MMDAKTKAAIIAELDATIAEGMRKPDEFDTSEFSAQTGRTDRETDTALRKLIDSGVLTRRKVLDDGHVRWVYRRVGNE